MSRALGRFTQPPQPPQGGNTLSALLARRAGEMQAGLTQSNEAVARALRSGAPEDIAASFENNPFMGMLGSTSLVGRTTSLPVKSKTDLMNLAERLGFDDVKAGKRVFKEIDTTIARQFGLAGRDDIGEVLEKGGLGPGVIRAMQTAYNRGHEAAFKRGGKRAAGPQTAQETKVLEQQSINLYSKGNRSGFSEDFAGDEARQLKNIIEELSERKLRTPSEIARDLRAKAGIAPQPKPPLLTEADLLRGISRKALK